MPAIQFTDRGTGVRVSEHGRTLARAAVAALAAPSILNTQPWRWRITDDVAELRADESRRLATLDPDGRLLVLSCGSALHHARVALAAEGVQVDVAHLPDGEDPGLLASIRYTGTTEAGSDVRRLRRAMSTRRTDRRPFSTTPVPEALLRELRRAAEAAGAHLHLPDAEGVLLLTLAATHAAGSERSDPAYLAELAQWVHRSDAEGVPPATTTPTAARPVPIRDFTATGADRSTIHDPLPPADRAARYAVLFTDGDERADWLGAGEALSAVLLTATAQGLATSPMSDLIEVPAARQQLRIMLGGIGHPALVLRIGMPFMAAGPTASPRRAPADVVEIDTAAQRPEAGR